MPFLLQRAHYNKKKVGVSVSHPSVLSPYNVRTQSVFSRDFVGAAQKAEVPGASEKGQNNPLSFTPGTGLSPVK